MNPVMQKLVETMMLDARKNIRVDVRWEVKGEVVYTVRNCRIHQDPLHPMALCTTSEEDEFTENEYNGEILVCISTVRYNGTKHERRMECKKTEHLRITKVPPYTIYFGDSIPKGDK